MGIILTSNAKLASEGINGVWSKPVGEDGDRGDGEDRRNQEVFSSQSSSPQQRPTTYDHTRANQTLEFHVA